MKTQKGVTLLSLILYMIALSIVIAMLGTISQLFFANTQYITENSKYVAEFNKFNMYFIEDVKKNKNTKEVTDNNSYKNYEMAKKMPKELIKRR